MTAQGQQFFAGIGRHFIRMYSEEIHEHPPIFSYTPLSKPYFLAYDYGHGESA